MHFRAACVLFALSVFAGAAVADDPPVEVDYLTQIKPLLSARCASCHGALKQESGLRLDAAQFIRAGGEIGSTLVPGKPEESGLLGAVTGDAGFTMPPEGPALKAEEIELLRLWIAQGAKAPEEEPVLGSPKDHWAYKRPVKSEVPQPANAAWMRNPIDAFIAAEREARGLVAQQPAPKHILLRRVYLDLIGLPPTPDELRAFLADESPNAYEKVVNRLLDSPHYGERWGRHWMDVWRYADWYGYGAELRNSARHIWRWRDWIVESVNTDKPYDQMIREMLAADELYPTDEDRLRGTGYLARHYYKFNRNVWLDNVIEHTGKAFMGVTLNCARCHDHMYDPVAQTEYYQFRAIFEPYQVRSDRLPGEANTEKDGLTLAYDAALDTPTYLFERGNEKNPVSDKPLTASVPAIFEIPYDLQPIELPAEAYYPGLRPHVRQETLAAATTTADARRKALEDARTAVAENERRISELSATASLETDATVVAPSPALQKALAEARREALVAEQESAAADAQLASVQARIAADDARYAKPPTANAGELAKIAAKSERDAALKEAQAAVARGELELDRAKAAPPSENAEKDKKPSIADLEKSLAESRKKLEEADAAAKQETAEYKPLTEVYPATSSGRRAALARWITDPRHPLTARVAVNQIWMRHFGQPLVPTVFDFGINGKPPSHPQLLDWLAVTFMENGWSTRELHRMIVLSGAYQMHSAAVVPGSRNAEIDPDNIYLWRMNTQRMEAELVRDSVLQVAGRLERTLGGPELDAAQGHSTFRRSIYYRHAPEKMMTFLQLFDNASTHECYRRAETIVPQQALALANSPLAIEQSRHLAAKLTEQCGDAAATGDSAFIDAAFERILCRPPSDEERAACVQFLGEQSAKLADPAQLTAFGSGDELAVAASTDPRQRARENLTHVLFNHNEFITRR